MISYQSYKKAFAAILFVVVLTGCVGEMSGIMRGQGGKVIVSSNGDDYTLSLPDGETFKGKRVVAHSSHFNGILIETPEVRSPFGDVAYYYHFGPYRRALVYGGILSGDRGHTMWCTIFSNGFGGGKGLCDISDGRTVDLEW